MSLLGFVLTRTILVAAAMLAFLFLVNGAYALSAMFVLSLAIYAYLLYWGDVPIEQRIV
ncbi:hypothetical protein ACFQPA_03100 [Halomarina halobia]|uniref:Uncharacterized protein n=1 Tax=Halomarina halobia TaxID=3033386 RepID=A0ABD6A4D4_9EURY|nr:hypothetical protein [Halomarina sp. PSR21]